MEGLILGVLFGAYILNKSKSFNTLDGAKNTQRCFSRRQELNGWFHASLGLVLGRAPSPNTMATQTVASAAIRAGRSGKTTHQP